jgi:phospholipase/carboxylesterase
MTDRDRMPAPVVSTFGSTDASAPLVVLFHGRGSNERDILTLAARLPRGVAYAALRGPISAGGGFTWFDNHGIGRPDAGSLSMTMAWFRGWLDAVAPAGRPVILVGFSGGAAFAGGLILSDPARYSGAAILYGTLPFDVGLRVERGQLAHLPVFLAHGAQDRVIPAELLSRTWHYLLEDSGAPVVAQRDAGGHELSARVVAGLRGWVADRFNYLSRDHVPPAGPGPAGPWVELPGGRLPVRRGGRPSVSWSIPQQQQSDTAPRELQERLLTAVSELPGVSVGPSAISVPGARGFQLHNHIDDDQALLVPSVGEFAHLHPEFDGSLHLTLPPPLAADLVVCGWGRMHPLAGTRLSPGFAMLFGPRDDEELATVLAVVRTSHAYATGSRTR